MRYTLLGDRLRAIRETKDLTQGDIEERTALLRSYISRIENSRTIPSVETLEKKGGPFRSARFREKLADGAASVARLWAR